MDARPWLAVAAIFAGYVLGGVALVAGLPEQIPPSWTTSDGEVIWTGRVLVAFLLPTASAVIDRLLRGLLARSQTAESNASGMDAIYDAILLRLATFLLGVHAVVLAGLLGLLWGRAWSAQIVPVMLGATMMSIGNLLPRTRPNLAFGIRTSRTLASRARWMTAHRRVGYALVGAGAGVVIASLTLPAPFGPSMILGIAPMVLIGSIVAVSRGMAADA